VEPHFIFPAVLLFRARKHLLLFLPPHIAVMPRLNFSSSLVEDVTPFARMGAEGFTGVLALLQTQIGSESAPSSSLMGKLGKQLGLEGGADAAATAFNALVFVVMELVGNKASVDDVEASLGDLKMSQENKAALVGLYQAEFDTFRAAMLDKTLRLPHYHNVDWRLDVVVASRSLQQQAEPSFLIELETRDNDDAAVFHTLTADYGAIANVCDELQAALEESRSKHAKRLLRYIG
jgi:hypothetical protein